MGGANSRASAEEIKSASAIAEELVMPLVDSFFEGIAKVTAGASPKNVLEFSMLSIKSMDEAVLKFVSRCNNTILQDNSEIFNAYYDASQKGGNAARAVRHYTNLSITELRRLQAVVRSYNKGTERSCELALKELRKMDVEKIDLPQSLVGQLEEAMKAYENVIQLCDREVQNLKKQRDEVNWVWKLLGVCCLIAIGVAISAVAPPVGAVVAAVGTAASVSISTATATTAVLTVGIGTAVVGASLTVLFTQRMHKLHQLATRIKEQQELLERTTKDTAKMMGEIKSLKDKVIVVQSKLQLIADGTSYSKGLEDMEDITCDDFLGSLHTQLKELNSLAKASDDLCKMVDDAFQLFKDKSELIVDRMRRGEKLY